MSAWSVAFRACAVARAVTAASSERRSTVASLLLFLLLFVLFPRQLLFFQRHVFLARLLLSPDPVKLAQFDTAQDTRETTRVTTGREIVEHYLDHHYDSAEAAINSSEERA